MKLRTQILLSILGITILAQVVFGFLAYREITESRGDQLTIFLQYLNREVAERITLPGNHYVSQIYLEELREKFSTPKSILIIQKDKKIFNIAGNADLDLNTISKNLNTAYADSDKHGLIEMDGIQYYWAVSELPNKEYQLVMLEPAHSEELQIANALRIRLISSGIIITWLAVWISLLLSSKISLELDEKNKQLKHIALHDSLTGLPNRTLLSDRMEQILLQAARNNQPFAFFLLDLDRFKEVNDTLGHHFGDELLKNVSKRLSDAIRENDSIARLGGDEFAVLLPLTEINGAELCARRILQAMEPHYVINGVSTESKASIGIALYPEHGNTPAMLMQFADVAMYQAKKSQTGYAVYDPSQNKNSVRRLRLMNDLREAIEKNQIKIFYQPIINNVDNKVISVEALARWHHPELGDISPNEFIPMAEQMGIIRTLTIQSLQHALEHCREWKKRGHNIGINVNLSVHCLQDFSLPNGFTKMLNQYGIDAKKVELEITESTLMTDLNRAGKTLEKLNKIGVQLAIDDFGTGFSSLSYLKNLPVDTLKIDKSFILDMNTSSKDKAVVKTIIELGHNLNCKVVAEGVETKEILDELCLLNVDKVQGHYFSEAMPEDELLDWLEKFENSEVLTS
ncbi:diguanylate cyclase/phosphodiesterase (GGDEF & EAL domains) with PAS/PAC sensor(s) [hydrothermal vent metagenome]|uniref:Diguanylate cyclase/phosphodiesterase (GGDEF & EAL domains) with PAS/PAC sensor(S) n=1 Tax=hydrothermal vent metagenome TaxID=652676 RepID=A0A3B0X6W2_9ZZZZ